jgi:hypothetical protein
MTDLMVFLLDIYCCTIFCNRTDEDEEDESADGDESDDDGGVVQGQKSDLLDSGSEGEDVNEIFGGSKAHEKSNFEKRQEKVSVEEN